MMSDHPMIDQKAGSRLSQSLIDSSRARPQPSSRESLLAAVLMVLLVLAALGPAVTQPASYHQFADQRAWSFMTNAMDVISNLPFALWGLWGLVLSWQQLLAGADGRVTAWLAGLFFTGLLVTSGVSSYYHLQPDDAGLVWDRCGMVLAFAGLLGLATVRAVSQRAAVVLALIILACGPLSVALWATSGNVLPWAVLQFGGMVLITWFAFMQAVDLQNNLRINWWIVMAVYTAAKLLELGDHTVFEWTNHLISGHSLKHIVASFAAYPVVSGLLRCQKIRAESARQTAARR